MASPRSPSPTGSTPSPVLKPTSRRAFSSSSTASSSDDEAVILRPRGKLAARMLGQAQSPLRSPIIPSNDARERVRRMLGLASKPEGFEDTTITGSQTATEAADHDGQDGTRSPRARKLQQRRPSMTPEEVEAEAEAAKTPSPRVSPAASRSSGLFVSSPIQPQSASAHSEANSSDSDPDLPTLKNAGRFKEILARKRQERLEREAEEERKRASRLARQQADSELMADSDDESNVTDDEGGRTLTQKSRPSRKASKKALEEMSRETQRMTRSLQLAHEAKTKKKITKASLFERFNFKPEGSGVSATRLSSSSRPASPVSAHHTDAEIKDIDTPPSSPPAPVRPTDDVKDAAPETHGDSMILEEDGDEFLTVEATFEAAARQEVLDKGKGRATTVELEEQANEEQSKKLPKVCRNVRVKLPAIHANVISLGSDDELDIQQPSKDRTKIDTILSRVPINKAKESRPMYMLRRLANLDDPDKKGSAPTGIGKRATKPSMTAAELQLALVQRARAQAKLERDRRLELLKSKGIHIPTEEEREKERAEVEDIVARAREEAEEIMLREREAEKKARKERKEAGEIDPLAWDDSDASDDEYEEGKEEEETKEIELSGSEEEDEEIGDEDEEAGSTQGAFIDDVAGESGTESGAPETGDTRQPDSDNDDEQAAVLRRPSYRRPKKQVVIVSDDEESEQHVKATPRPKVAYRQSPSASDTASPKIPTSVLRSATKTFIPGLPVAGPAGLGLTQIFAGTMDDSQAAPLGASPSQMMPTFDNFPDSQFSQTAQGASADVMILDSQPTQGATQTQAVETQEGVLLHFSQSQVHGFDSLLQQTNNTQQTDVFEPTQDAGFQEYTPLRHRFVEPPASTIDTVVLAESQKNEPGSDSPLVQRPGKLRRRADVLAASRAVESEEEEEENLTPMEAVEFDEFGFGTTSAFTVMQDAAARAKKLKAKAAFDKKKSKAREMVDEQADESDDEYAGLGGVDGEDSDDESTASVQEMVDDDTKLSEADKAKLKAFYADRERASDEKQVEQLFKDITKGMLRRKRGAGDYDLSDSDDGGEAKRRMKRRQFAKMQKALFADERVSKVAENPRTQAFLRTIEDRGSDDEMDFLFAPPAQPVPESQEEDSQQSDAVPDSQPQQHAPAAAPYRRTRDGRKPTTIGDIRASLSNLLEEPALGSSLVPATDIESPNHSADEAVPEDDEAAADGDKENRNPRRTSGRAVVVDRISLKRNSSSNISTDSSGSGSGSGRLAFAASGGSSAGGGFKVPALLRRATTNSLRSTGGGSSVTSSSFSPATTTAGGAAGGVGGGAGGFGQEAKIKRNAGKKSGINYFARENERRAAVAESEKRREARKWKGAEGRGKVVGSLFSGGKFE